MKDFSKKLQEKFAQMSASGKLFKVELSGDKIWDLYLNSFSKENNPVFRDPESSTFNCNHCKNFIRRYGNVVSLDENYNIVSIFDVETTEEFANTAKVLTTAITGSKIKDVFLETYKDLNDLPYESCNKQQNRFQLGVAKNQYRYTEEEAYKYGSEDPGVQPNELKTFHHMHLFLDKAFVDASGKSVESIIANFREPKNVFQRGMETIPLDTLNLVRDLIKQGSLRDAEAHLHKIEQFSKLKQEYDNLPSNQRENWCWVKSYNFIYAGFRNELIGVLCKELAEGEDLNKACLTWNKRVDPINYMKVLAPFTERQKKDAIDIIENNGYKESFDRRFATMDDIRVSEILHSNVGSSEIKKVSMFDNLKTPSTRHKRSEFDGVEEVSIEKFMKDILPSCSSVEAYLANSHDGNMVSLTTANNPDSKLMFKWANNYSWTFNGNLAGKSEIKQAVKTAGGKIDGVLRFSITWNKNGNEILDFDAHALEPNGTEIFYSTYKGRKSSMSGMLDVDMIRPSKLGVENIVHTDLSKMAPGLYKYWIKNFDGGRNSGFEAEIELLNGETYNYVYNQQVKGDIYIAEVTLKNGVFSIKHLIPESESSITSKEIYGLETNKFHKVNLICLSPNHWGTNEVGNKHYMFMLEDCKSPDPIRSYHSENFNSELVTHRKVLEPLGAVNMIESTDKQLSGLGFNATVRDELIVKVQGSHKRTLKIKF